MNCPSKSEQALETLFVVDNDVCMKYYLSWGKVIMMGYNLRINRRIKFYNSRKISLNMSSTRKHETGCHDLRIGV